MSNQTNITVKTFKVTTDVGTYNIDMSAIPELNVYESLVSPGITGDFLLQDWGGLKEIGEIYAGDKIDIVWQSEERPEKTMQFIVYASEDTLLPDSSYNLLRVKFCSSWLFEAMTKQVSKPYKDKFIHEIIEDLLLECGLSKSDIVIDPTLQKIENFVSPLWTVIHTIKYLLSFALSENGERGGYIIWEDFRLKKIMVVPVFRIFQGYFDNAVDTAIPFKPNVANPLYLNRIHEQTFESNFDEMRQLNVGYPNQILYCFNYDKTELIKTEETIIEYDHPHLSTNPPLRKKILATVDSKGRSVYSSTSFITLFPSTDAPISDVKQVEDFVYGRSRNTYTMLFSDKFKINAIVNPDSDRRVGRLVHLIYESVDPEKIKKGTGNDMFSGTWVIRNIRHIVSGASYSQVCTFVMDGYKRTKRGDLEVWQ